MVLIHILLFIGVSAYIDYEHLKDNDYIESHVSRGFLRALFILVVSNYHMQYLIGCSLLFIALFDTLLNYMRGVNIFYLGNTALWDRFWSKIPYLYVVFKVACLFVGFYLMIL